MCIFLNSFFFENPYFAANQHRAVTIIQKTALFDCIDFHLQMLVGRKKSGSSFGPDGRRLNGPIVCSRSAATATTTTTTANNRLFQPGAKLLIRKAPLMPGLLPSFQRPTNKRRTHARHQEEALRKSSLGPRKRMDGMQKLLARAGKGLAFQLPQQARPHGDGDTEEDDSNAETDEEAEKERPFEPLRVWHSPHDGGEPKGLPPRLYVSRRVMHHYLPTCIAVFRIAHSLMHACTILLFCVLCVVIPSK